MKACVQRVSEARVTVSGEVVGEIGHGLMVLLGVARGDDESTGASLARKLVELRIFDDEGGKMNRSLEDVGGSMLLVSQFTLLGDCRKGRRPSYVGAAAPGDAERLYEYVAEQVRQRGVPVATGRFRAMMDVALVNQGPVTLLLEVPSPADVSTSAE